VSADAGDAAAGVSEGGALAGDAGVLAGGSPDSGANDAGADLGAQALSDSQLLALADALSSNEIAQAQAALPASTDADVQRFATQLTADHQAARATLSTLATGLGVTPASSSLSEQLAQESAAALQQLAAADAGGIDLLFVSSQVAELSRALTLLGQLEAAADAAALRAELVVLQSIVQQELSLARSLAALR
jgi:predicted outer membrane protein